MFKCFSTLCVSPIQVERGHIGVVRKENFEAATKRGAISIILSHQQWYLQAKF
ncbi:hypothetical protein MTR_2g435500 [Medicago truncatula]|uniref:Uncharacterized protein n=1 Tax=Medicago truncatula TaxID=3880 RepID=A0A072V577_MEDTR|nr:hypothetical protein MTR_2g435500 [Medicago truncatula]